MAFAMLGGFAFAMDFFVGLDNEYVRGVKRCGVGKAVSSRHVTVFRFRLTTRRATCDLVHALVLVRDIVPGVA
jgi:hypothetical protein